MAPSQFLRKSTWQRRLWNQGFWPIPAPWCRQVIPRSTHLQGRPLLRFGGSVDDSSVTMDNTDVGWLFDVRAERQRCIREELSSTDANVQQSFCAWCEDEAPFLFLGERWVFKTERHFGKYEGNAIEDFLLLVDGESFEELLDGFFNEPRLLLLIVDRLDEFRIHGNVTVVLEAVQQANWFELDCEATAIRSICAPLAQELALCAKAGHVRIAYSLPNDRVISIALQYPPALVRVIVALYLIFKRFVDQLPGIAKLLGIVEVVDVRGSQAS
jgi:hypothetical protein